MTERGIIPKADNGILFAAEEGGKAGLRRIDLSGSAVFQIIQLNIGQREPMLLAPSLCRFSG